MQQSMNVEMIVACGLDGSLQPLRFRYRDSEGERRLAKVLEVLSCQEIKYIYVEAYLYTCRVRIDDEEQTLQVRYAIRTHQWFLFQRIF